MGFTLTKAHIIQAFEPLSHITPPSAREPFFTNTLDPAVRWTVLGRASSLSGTRVGVADHAAATFDRLLPKLRAPIKFTVVRVLVEAEPVGAGLPAIAAGSSAQDGQVQGIEPEEEVGWWACVEIRGEAIRKNGEPYDNDYLWLTRWNNEGKIVEIRTYFDTLLAEQVLNEPVAT